MPEALVEFVVLLLAVGLLWLVWAASAQTVAVSVDGVDDVVRTHRATVGRLLVDLGLNPQPQDRVTPGLDTPLADTDTIAIARAHPVRVLADGRDMTVASWATTPREVLAEAGILIDTYDRVVLNGEQFAIDDPLPMPAKETRGVTYDRGYAWLNVETKPVQLQLYRAIPITVDDGGLPFTVRTTAQTVGEALREAEIMIYLGDRVMPSMGSRVNTGLNVFIQRSTPLAVAVDGRRYKTRTRGETVSDALSEMGITTAGLDRVQPTLESELYDNMSVAITRVAEDVEIEEEIAPFETIFEPDPNLLIDTQQVVAPGAEGITRTRFRVLYEDGVEADRTLEDTWIAQQPAQRVIAFGQRIEPNTFTAANGQQITYWRKIRMSASSYSAGTAGVSPDKPWYGRTYTGEPMRFGIVAVDPKIIPLRTGVFVPGYGKGEALDTGSAVISRRIDLGYDDDNLVLWSKWVDVYLLWPPPPDYQITWVIPNWPRVPQ